MSRCFVEDKIQLCQLSSKRLEEKWHNWYSTALFLYTPRTPPPPKRLQTRPTAHIAGTAATATGSSRTVE